jgi:DNA-directed RNA polymerase subunit alpha
MLDTLLSLEAPPEVVPPRVEVVGENRFVVEPLERGYGVTLGNSLRRVLLASLTGAAVTHLRIDGVLHEFSTVPGVREDTTEIILNLKKLRLRLMTDKRKLLRLESSGPGVVTASDIMPDPEVEILNPDLVIAHLEEKNARLGMDLYVASGTGYVPAEKQSLHEHTIGIIPVDSIFSPILKVNYWVEDTRVGQRTDFDRLILEVHTDGSLRPYEAVSRAAQLLREKLNLFAELQPPSARPAEPSGPEAELMETPIEKLELSVRSLNCLKRAGIQTIGELLQYSVEDVMKLKNFGQKSLDEIVEKLAGRGLSLRPSVPE